MNRIIKVELSLTPDGRIQVDVTKEFAPENGGGTQVFTESTHPSARPNWHGALDVARGMVTLTPARREA